MDDNKSGETIFDGIKDPRETRVQRGFDFFMTRNQQYLSKILNEPNLHNVIRINRELFMISNTREFKLYDSQY